MAEIAAIDPSKPSPAISRMGSEIARDDQLYTRRSGDLADKQTASFAEREKVLAPMEADLQVRMAEPTPARPKTEIPQFKPQPIIDAKDYEALSYGLIAMAMIGGVASQGKWLEVGATLNGALQGYLEGNELEAQKRYKDYDEQFKGAIAKEAQANREFEDILKDRHMRIGDQINAYRIVAAKYDRQDALSAAQSRSLDQMWRSIESRKTAMARLEESHERATQRLNTGRFTGENGDLMAALAERGISLPAGFRSAEQQSGLLDALRRRNPNMSADQIADQVKNGQIDLANVKKMGQVAAGIAGKVSYAENEILGTVPQVREAMAKVPRGKFVPFNEIRQRGEAAFSDPNLADYAVYMTSLSNAYDMLAARGGTDKDKRAENRKLFDTARSAEAVERVLKAIEREAKISGEAAKKSMESGKAAGGSSGEPAARGGAAPALPAGWSVEEVR